MLLVFLDFLFLPTDRPLVLSPVSNTWYELKIQNKNPGFILESENEGGISLLHLQNRGIFKILGGGGGGGGGGQCGT